MTPLPYIARGWLVEGVGGGGGGGGGGCHTTSSQGETTPDSEVPGSKHPKWSGPDKEAYNNPTVMTVDSP